MKSVVVNDNFLFSLFACLNGEILRLRGDLLIMMEDTDTEHGLAILQAVIGLNDRCITDALAWQDALDEHILGDTDMLITSDLGY